MGRCGLMRRVLYGVNCFSALAGPTQTGWRTHTQIREIARITTTELKKKPKSQQI
jgi:hypothetical protein